MDKILLVIGDAVEALDTMVPYFRLSEDYKVDIAGPQARVYHMVMHEKPHDWDITREGPSYHLKADIAFRDVNPNDYLGLVISGGRAPEYLRYDVDLIRITRKFFGDKKPVACVCHGIEIVAAADVIRNREVTTVAKCKFDAEFSGATYLDQPVVVSGNLCTARTWHDSAPWMKTYVKMLQEYKR